VTFGCRCGLSPARSGQQRQPSNGPVGAALSDLIDDLAGRHVVITRGWPQQFDPRASQETFNYMIDAYLASKFGEARPDSKLSNLIDHDRKRTSLQARWQTYFTDDRTAQIQRHSPRRSAMHPSPGYRH
jgi:hypothetical protein